ncbi:PLDc N-terminal domain-containing protein [Mycoplasma sp. Pen4]|uniref:phospholipase D-like domain-containing protein n=1 Tax=Mycoplasma sp. Pen4 TaxID=640330 RepID=UPI001654AC06|nr:phospholipase D-like domain-containing protein [Mycoplasma sp. Pen4]QNM93778.1 PLDc N-terminal domain-containing protein [Mycoplasma sp. Pen4]
MNKLLLSTKRTITFIILLAIFVGSITGIAFLITQIDEQWIYLSLVLFYLVNCVFVFIIYTQKRQHESKFSWIYLVLLFPIIGHVIFLTYGLIFKNKYELKLLNDPKFHISTYKDLINVDNDNGIKSETLKQYANINQSLVLDANYKLYNEGYRFYEKLMEVLFKAKKNIYIVTYIIKKSEISKEFLEVMRKKADEGVEIKWLVDDFGAMPSQKRLLKKLSKHPNIEIRFIGKIYYPFVLASSFLRNHQKFIIVDDLVVFSGGNNISDEYASLSKKYGHWIDLNYEITGPYINNYIVHFALFWKIITRKDIEIKKHLFIDVKDQIYHNKSILVTESPSFDHSEAELFWIKMISSAKKSIKIATPYFSVTSALKKQIILALKCGVDVTIYFPGFPDKKTVHKIGIYQLKELTKYGLKIKIYKDHFLHTKCGLIDDKIAWIGTNNLDSRSMFQQYETMDIVEGETVKDIQGIFDLYDQHCVFMEKVPQLCKKPNVIEKFLYDLVKPLI